MNQLQSMTPQSFSSNGNADAELLALIAKIAANWQECFRLEELGDRDRVTALIHEIDDLEHSLIDAEVTTAIGLAAKIRAIRDAQFEAEDMAHILDRLAVDANRITAG